MTHHHDDEVRALLARAVPDVTPPADVQADLARGRVALGRRRSLLATVAVGVGTALVVAGAVTLPERLGARTGGAPAATSTTRVPDPAPVPTRDGAVATPADPVPLEPATQTQQAGDVVATVLPRGWSVVRADPVSLVAGDGREGVDLVVAPTTHPGAPPVLGGVGDFERLGGTSASYYLVDTALGAARPALVFELTHGRWAQVTASPALGWGSGELSAFASGLRAPLRCDEPCEVPLAP